MTYDPVTDPFARHHLMLQTARSLDRIIPTLGDGTVGASALRLAALVLRDEIVKSTPSEAQP